MHRPTIHRLLASLALAAAVLAPAAGPAAAAPASCSAGQGQTFIDSGKYDKAMQAFSCVIDAHPTDVEGYRGRIEAEVLLARYSDAVRDEQRITAFVLPVHPDAESTIVDGYAARLAAAPGDISALTGMTFTQWWFFHYPQAIQWADKVLAVKPDDLFGTLFRGSARVSHGIATTKGVADLDRAIQLAPSNPHVRFIVADAYTYGLPDPQRAFAEANLALAGGLDTPRVHAILAVSDHAFGDEAAAAFETAKSISLAMSGLVTTTPLAAGGSASLQLGPGQVAAIPIPVTAGETVSIATSSQEIWDSIAVLLAPDGTPVIGADDVNKYMAAFDWVAPQTATYTLWVTSFEAATPGTLVVQR